MQQRTLNLLAALLLFVIHWQSMAHCRTDVVSSFNVLHYLFELHLNDFTDKIEGKASVFVHVVCTEEKFTLDLNNFSPSTGKGMQVDEVTVNEKISAFDHQNNRLDIFSKGGFKQGDTVKIVVKYSGVPADGLIISENKFGNRTFFADNWPNRAHFWIPCVDHPSDKATVEFWVFAPNKYQVIANGSQMEETDLEDGFRLTRWSETKPVSTKIMVIGVAQFAVLNNGIVEGTSVSTWVFPENRQDGFSEYAVGTKPLAFFSKLIGPFGYSKLAHVQSKTRYGGMENAGAVFYAESTVNGRADDELLMAHETAHQWFGDAVTERNWHHLWLSEGFATYLTLVYLKEIAGDSLYRQRLIASRKAVNRYEGKKSAPVIDTTVTNYNELLNANTYQKGAWFLHMLNHELGDSLFFESLRLYYLIYRDSTALTKDFQHVVEMVSQKNWNSFFHQWLFRSGHPKLKTEWSQNGNLLKMNIMQKQLGDPFFFPLTLKFVYTDGRLQIETVNISEQLTQLRFKVCADVKEVIYDPDISLLFETTF